MKQKLSSVAVALACMLYLSACATLERGSYFTYTGLSTAVEQARQAYGKHLETCNCITVSQDARIGAGYDKYQKAMKIVGDIVEAYKGSDTVPDSPDIRAAVLAAAASASDIYALIESMLPPDKSATLKAKVPKNAKLVLTKEGK